MRLVVDASVAIKWFLPEEIHSDSARRWLDMQTGMVVPDLFFAETTNIVWKKVGRGQLEPQDARLIQSLISGLTVTVRSCRGLSEASLELALELGCSGYDAHYLALAREERTMLITADSRLVKRVEGRSIQPLVRWVEDLPLN